MTQTGPLGMPARHGRTPFTVTILAAGLVAVAAVVATVPVAPSNASASGPPSARASGPHHAAAVVPGSYVALGDSYTSGPAIPTQLGPTTDPSAPASCLRSSDNYPSLTARALGLDLVDASCGGATTEDMDTSQGPGIPAQLDALRTTTSVVSLGIGGNDLGFSTIATNCAAYTPWGPTRVGWSCRAHYSAGGGDQLAVVAGGVEARVARVLRQIRARAPRAAVFVVGYPDIVPPTGSGCWPRLPFTAGDVGFLRGTEAELDAALATAAADTGAHYVDTATPSADHSACAPRATRRVEPGLPSRGSYPLHPDATGMAGMARVVEAALRSAGTE
jgi:lysophospholipase L1-like esterase